MGCLKQEAVHLVPSMLRYLAFVAKAHLKHDGVLQKIGLVRMFVVSSYRVLYILARKFATNLNVLHAKFQLHCFAVVRHHHH